MPWPKVRAYFIPFNHVLIADVFFIVCIKLCGRLRLHSWGQRYPRCFPSMSMTGLRQSHPHMAAVYLSGPSGSEPWHVMMYLAHQSILSLYCDNLPVLLTSVSPPTTLEAPHEVPVVPIALPNPESFLFLTQSLYFKNVRQLFEAFLSQYVRAHVVRLNDDLLDEKDTFNKMSKCTIQ